MSLLLTPRQWWSIFAAQDPKNVLLFFSAVAAVCFCGALMIIACLRKFFPTHDLKPQPQKCQTKQHSATKANAQRHAFSDAIRPTFDRTRKELSNVEKEIAEKVSTLRRSIVLPSCAESAPLAHLQQAQLLERGNRLLNDGDPKQGLACFLAILHSSLEMRQLQLQAENPEKDFDSGTSAALPPHLPDCLRGAALAFRALGDTETALKFHEVERILFETVVSKMLSTNADAQHEEFRSLFPPATTEAKSFVDLLFKELNDPAEGNTIGVNGAQTRQKVSSRYYTLRDVADVCMKCGYPKIALSYRVKAAALRRKATKKPLDQEGEDMLGILEAMEAVEKSSYPSRSQEGAKDDKLIALQRIADSFDVFEDDTDEPPLAEYDPDDEDSHSGAAVNRAMRRKKGHAMPS